MVVLLRLQRTQALGVSHAVPSFVRWSNRFPGSEGNTLIPLAFPDDVRRSPVSGTPPSRRPSRQHVNIVDQQRWHAGRSNCIGVRKAAQSRYRSRRHRTHPSESVVRPAKTTYTRGHHVWNPKAGRRSNSLTKRCGHDVEGRSANLLGDRVQCVKYMYRKLACSGVVKRRIRDQRLPDQP